MSQLSKTRLRAGTGLSVVTLIAFGLMAIPANSRVDANTTAATTKPVALYATQPQARTGQGVTLMAATNSALAPGQSLSIINVTTNQTINTITQGTTVSTTVTHHSATTQKFAAVLTTESSPLTVSWVDRPIGNNAGYANAAGQTVTLNTSSQAAATLPLVVSAVPSGFKSPMYQFWWAMQGGAWHNSGSFSAKSTVSIIPPRNGFLSVVVYTREATAPSHETSAQQAQYEAKSDTAVVTVGPPVDLGGSGNTVSQNGWVSLTTPNQIAVGSNINLQANVTGITTPIYQFWFESPQNGWQSSGPYSTNANFQVSAVTPGTWHVVVYARPETSPPNETTAQRSQLEVQSPVTAVVVHS